MALSSSDFFSEPVKGSARGVEYVRLSSLTQSVRSQAGKPDVHFFTTSPTTDSARASASCWPTSMPTPAVPCRRPVVLAGHDSASFNYSSLGKTDGLGYINDSPTAKGLHPNS